MLLLATAGFAAPPSTFDSAVALQRQGKYKEARDLFRVAAKELRSSADYENAATALSTAGALSISFGDYAGAIGDELQAPRLVAAALRTSAGTYANDDS